MNCIKNIICSQTVTTDNGVILIPNKSITPANLSEYRLIIACNVNTPTANNQLFIQTSTGNSPVLCKYGNTLLANQVNKRIPYIVLFGDQNVDYSNGQFVIVNCSCLNARGVSGTTAVTTNDDISL